MITNVIAFLSSIATAVFIGIGVVAINVKNKTTQKRKDLAGLFTRLANISNTYMAYPQMQERFANLQAAYYLYKQNHVDLLQEQLESVDLINNLKKLLYVAISIWVLESGMIIFSGRNFLEYFLATVIIVILAALFLKFSEKFKDMITDFSAGVNFPDPDSLLDPLTVPEKNQYAYVADDMPLNLLESGIVIEFDPPLTPPPRIDEVADDESDEETVPIYDFSHFEANGRLLFAFPYKFTGELHFFTRQGDTGEAFPVSSDFFKAGFSHVYDITFPYHTPLHHLEKAVLYINAGRSGPRKARVTFNIPLMDALPEKSELLMQPIAVKASDEQP